MPYNKKYKKYNNNNDKYNYYLFKKTKARRVRRQRKRTRNKWTSAVDKGLRNTIMPKPVYNIVKRYAGIRRYNTQKANKQRYKSTQRTNYTRGRYLTKGRKKILTQGKLRRNFTAWRGQRGGNIWSNVRHTTPVYYKPRGFGDRLYKHLNSRL